MTNQAYQAIAEIAAPKVATMAEAPFPAWPAFEQDEQDAVQAVLRSGRVNYWTGTRGRELEKAIAAACDSRHAIVMANGSVTLDAILKALEIGPGDEVIVTPRSFLASASCIALAGARPVFADVDLTSQNITPETVRPLIGARTRAIIAVHLGGWPCDMIGLKALADEHGLALIEDCAQAHGARLHGRPAGSFGDVASFSFCQDKIVTTGGEGGAVVTDDDALWERIWSFKDHGKSYAKCQSQDHPPGYRWLHDGLGTNLRMTEMQAAIGLLQYRKLPGWIAARRRNARMLDDGFRDLPALRLAEPPAEVEHAYYKYYVFVRRERLRPGWSRDRIMAEVNARGIVCLTGGCPELYRERTLADHAPASPLPNARRLGEESLMLQVHPTLKPAHIQRVIEGVRDVVQAATA